MSTHRSQTPPCDSGDDSSITANGTFWYWASSGPGELDLTGYEGYLNNSYGPPINFASNLSVPDGGAGGFALGALQGFMKPFAFLQTLTWPSLAREQFLQSFEPRTAWGMVARDAAPLFGLLIPGVGEGAGGVEALEGAQGASRFPFAMGLDSGLDSFAQARGATT